MIKMIAIDLDGTLLNDDKKIIPENLEALHYAHSKGVKIVICTGRPYLAMKYLVDEIGLNTEEDYVIVFNGAQVRRASDGKVLLSNTLSPQDFELWYAETARLDLPINPIDDEWVYEPLAYPEGYPSFYTTKLSNAPATVKDYATFSEDHRFNKFVITVDEEHLTRQRPKINQQLMEDYSVSLSHPFQLEVMSKGTDKGSAIVGFAKKLGLDLSEIVAIGDQENDRQMLSLPLNSVAMGNASDSLKELADYVTGTNNDSGVAQAIYHYLEKE
ncbi:HAD family phosphatase [Aerococcaceae bacterium DSM 111020]|nr:HAD family phosphatase [Aerococcaceae bacterium DSM 111020]